MKKTLTMSIACLTLLLVACQPTPEGEVIANKGNGGFEAQIVAAPSEDKSYEAPQSLKIEAFGTDSFQVVVDAAVNVPIADRYPVIEVEQRELTAEWTQDIILRMTEGRALYSIESEIPQTKQEILKEISLYQDMLANPDDYLVSITDEKQRAEQISEWEEMLELWQTAYQNAPDSYEEQKLDLSLPAIADSSYISGSVDFDNGRKAYISISRFTDGAGGNIEFNSMDKGVGLPFNYDMNSDFHSMNGLTISRDRAVQMGLDYIEKLGETGFAPVLVLAGYCEPTGVVPAELSLYPQCFKIYFTRSVLGIPATYRDSRFDIFDPTFSSQNEEQYAPYCPQEYIAMVIRDSGVNYMYWEMPGKLGRTVSENVKLLPFENIVERFTSQVLYEADFSFGTDSSIVKKTLVIDRIELGMIQLRKRDSSQTLLYVPAWSFFGKTLIQYSTAPKGGLSLNENNEYISEIPGYSYLIINAIDGTVIDKNKGY